MQYLFVFLLCVAAASATNFRTCSGDRPSPNTVTVSGCETLPCDFIKGSDLINDIEFSSPIPADNMKPLVLVTILGLTIEYPLEYQDACADLISGGCPLDVGENAIYHLVMPILEEYPLVSMTIEFSLLDQGGETVTCLEMDGQVVEA